MSALRINADISLLSAIWFASIFFFAISVLLCAVMTFRRIRRNRWKRRRKHEEGLLHSYLNEVIRTRISPAKAVENMPTSSASVIADVLLHYFRTLKGKGIEHLQSVICESHLESVIADATHRGICGHRMRALKVLSYLPSQSSLPFIFDHLSSENKYVRITAARGLVRRKTIYWLDPIMDSYSEAFPYNVGLLANILSGFGADIIPALNTHIMTSEDDMIKATCLETLVLLMPAKTELNLTKLANHPDERIRAAALSLSAVTPHTGGADPIRQCLSDSSVKVKIRATKIAYDSKRVDIVSDLYALSEDPVIWVRYWALKAIWRSGSIGRQFVTTLSNNNQMARNLVLELKSGYV